MSKNNKLKTLNVVCIDYFFNCFLLDIGAGMCREKKGKYYKNYKWDTNVQVEQGIKEDTLCVG